MATLLATRLRLLRSRALRRFLATSLLSTGLCLAVITLLAGDLELDAPVANVAGTLVGGICSYELNRHWVWSGGRGGARARAAFLALTLAGMVLSTALVAAVAAAAASVAAAPGTVAWLADIANLTAIASLLGIRWMLSRHLFAPRSHRA